MLGDPGIRPAEQKRNETGMTFYEIQYLLNYVDNRMSVALTICFIRVFVHPKGY
jgi:hypothetical protein